MPAALGDEHLAFQAVGLECGGSANGPYPTAIATAAGYRVDDDREGQPLLESELKRCGVGRIAHLDRIVADGCQAVAADNSLADADEVESADAADDGGSNRAVGTASSARPTSVNG